MFTEAEPSAINGRWTDRLNEQYAALQAQAEERGVTVSEMLAIHDDDADGTTLRRDLTRWG